LAGAHRNNRSQPEPAGRLPRFRYAVPAPISEARFVLRIGLTGLECGIVGTLIRTLISLITQSKLIHGVGAVR
jgi:hypothetical protein